ncbi:hypothetical protein KP509_16G074600 [Ceratopteris richardii]|uniref:Small rubber particle protein n=1 Tax=Ceratopteris richardii TaxID=49495 RepID=A0A8T2T1K6_CERRI|nr:hypothetical protein KP509_16G074600 [Ceratopteris richardii]KAH7388413.1 hypothetical protein KP509_16G074600 [Ceratopteris richardii]KAH7388414.1 hypothetical protein KP509_16G074600 [Ceratopteris richardii]KAH7388415.1 hypothetical protein KP509_16G074600 [Ceratopteris richardii]
MASSSPDVSEDATVEQTEQPGLKYLGVFEVVVDKATKYVASIYEIAKENSGPLKPGVTTAENSVRTVAGPVYQKIEGKPYEVLLFVDRKVDDAVGKIGGVVPQNVKEVTSQAYGVARQVPEVVKSVVSDLQTNGLVETAKTYYSTYEPVAEEWTRAAWNHFLKFPYAPQAVHFAAPPTLFCAEKFNQVVEGLKGKNVPLANYIPTVPVDKLEKAVKVDSS